MSLIAAFMIAISPIPLPPTPMEMAVADILAGETLATATTGAERTGNSVQETPTQPPPPTAPPTPTFSGDSYNGRCVGAEPLLAYYSPGWDVARMSRIIYRESRCQPGADNPHSTATGLLQILASHCPWLAGQMGESCSAAKLSTANFNIRAGAVLWEEQGYSAWSLS